QRRQWSTIVADAQSRRGHAFASVALWADARRDLEGVLETLGDSEVERQAELHAELAEASYWMLDIPSVHEHASAAVHLATVLGRHDVLMVARGWRAGAHAADGEVELGIQEYEQAVSR